MELRDREVNYAKDSQRIVEPKNSLDVLERLQKELGVEVTELEHRIAPKLKIKRLENNDTPFYMSDMKTSLGKGLSEEQSLASAVGEHIERLAVTRFMEDRDKNPRSLGKKIDLDDLLYEDVEEAYLKRSSNPWQGYILDSLNMLFRGKTSEYNKLNDWTEFHSLMNEEKMNLHVDVFNTSKGLAAGNCVEEAIFHGMLEVIEKHEHASVLPEITYETLTENVYLPTKDIPGHIRKYFDERKLEKVLIVYSRSEICPAVHVFQSLAFCRHRNPGIVAPDVDIAAGMGANLDPEQALQRSLTELVQILASVDEVDELVEPKHFSPEFIRLDELENKFDKNLKTSIELCIENLEASDVLVKDITPLDHDLSTIKCVIPETRGVSMTRIGADVFEEILDMNLNLPERLMVKQKRLLK